MSDPSWISAGAVDSDRRAARERRAQQIRDKPAEPKRTPDILVYWNPECDYGIEYNVEIYGKNQVCENCEKVGAYVIREDHMSMIGACRKCLEADKKTILKVVELPKIHNY